MLIEFRLTFPNIGSWNGKFSGESNYYAKVLKITDKEKAQAILKEESYGHCFGDGWSARVSVRQVDSKEKTKILKMTRGFMGYDWMVSSIIKNGFIEYERNHAL